MEGNRLRNLPREVWMAPRLRELNCMNNEIIQLSLTNFNLDNRNHNRNMTRNSRYTRKQEHENFFDKRSLTQNDLNVKNAEKDKKQFKETNKIKKVEKISDSDIIR